MILTLADRNILDEQGDLDDDAPDELENALVVRIPPANPVELCAGVGQGIAQALTFLSSSGRPAHCSVR